MLKVENLSFAYNNTPILNQINFEVKKGEHLSVIGESGSGKSTLLKLLYGTYDLNEGHIFWNEKKILGPKFNLVVGYDFMKYVSQEFDLMPFTSVSENIGAFLSNFYPEEKQKRIAELLKVVELEAFANVKVKTLSGGQKQRVAIARAIAKQPEIIVLDEPFSHIDNFKKQSLRRSLFKYLKEQEITCIVATHDKNDVLSFADNMMVLHDTKIVAYNTPKTLYKQPKNKLIASFFGEFNHIEPYGIVYANQLKIVSHSTLKATVKQNYFKGHYYLVEAEIAAGKIIFFEHETALTLNQTICLSPVS
ncbi:MAG: ABC transporter ATP-binding protein [Flavobacteriaceae bacterium]